MISRIPTDSSDVAEQRELEASRAEAEVEAQRRHDRTCIAGWLGEDQDGHPVPCGLCRPHLTAGAACTTCQTPSSSCVAQRGRGRGSCCALCRHPALAVIR